LGESSGPCREFPNTSRVSPLLSLFWFSKVRMSGPGTTIFESNVNLDGVREALRYRDDRDGVAQDA
jgi:hypothetical protein